MTPKIGDKLGQRAHLTEVIENNYCILHLRSGVLINHCEIVVQLDIKKINAFYHCDGMNTNSPPPTNNLIPKPPLIPSIDGNGIESRKLDDSNNSSNGNDSRFAVDGKIFSYYNNLLLGIYY